MIPLVILVFKALIWVVILDALASWVVRSPGQFPRNLTGLIADPLCAPVRAVVKPGVTGGIDFSPLVVIILLQVCIGLVAGAGF